MSDQNQQRTTSNIRMLCVILMSALVFAGCNATTKPKRAASSIQIEEAVGFTITEEVKISESVRLKYYEALNYLNAGQLERGIAILEKVAETAPLVTAPRIDLGMAHHRNGDLEAAERNLLKALELNASHPVAQNELGIIYRKTGRFKEAKQHYEAAIAVYPGYHHARRNLAILCDLYLGDLNCALNQYEAYMATVPADEEASMWIADLRNRMAAR
jgi:Flp pilus assembly protein TadD